MESTIRYRYARAEDREAVLGITPTLYDGFDVLSTTYLDNIKHPAKLMFVGEQRGKVVAFLQHTLVDDGKTIVVENAKVIQSFHHMGVLKYLGVFAEKESLQYAPHAQQLRWSSLNAEATHKAINSSPARILAKRKAVFTTVEAKPLRAFFASERFHQLYETLDLKSSLVQTPDSACRILQESSNKELFPDDLLFCQWIPYAPLPSNYREITKQSVTVTTQDPCTRELLAVSFATENIVKAGRRIVLTIHTSCDPVLISLVKSHIIKHMILLNQYISGQRLRTNVVFHLPKNTNVEVVSTFLVNVLGLTIVEPRVREAFYVKRPLWVHSS